VLFVLQVKRGSLYSQPWTTFDTMALTEGRNKVVHDRISQVVILSQMKYTVFAMTSGTRFAILITDDQPNLLVPSFVVGLVVPIFEELD
jgi:hypothetical protein